MGSPVIEILAIGTAKGIFFGAVDKTFPWENKPPPVWDVAHDVAPFQSLEALICQHFINLQPVHRKIFTSLSNPSGRHCESCFSAVKACTWVIICEPVSTHTSPR